MNEEQIVKRAQKQLLDEIFQLWDGEDDDGNVMFNFWIEMGYLDERGAYIDRQEA